VAADVDSVIRSWLPPQGRILYYPNPGNAGDALIATATWQCFDRLGIRPTVTQPAGFARNAHVVLGGGGNLIPQYHDIANALQACLEHQVSSCLLLPHTIRGHETLLNRLDRRFTLLCRDHASLMHVQRHAPNATALLADDMALALDIAALRHRTSLMRHRLALLLDRDWLKRRRKWRRALSRQKPDAEGMLTVLRSDVEANTSVPRPSGPDVMHFYTTRCLKRAGCDQATMDIIELLRSAKSVLTDRLHVALPSAILGLEVNILDNNYGKLSAVWETSLQGRYPNTRMA
jgi:exopolysaccharide biosynthesis predicted pyruvyltransferase EpsI